MSNSFDSNTGTENIASKTSDATDATDATRRELTAAELNGAAECELIASGLDDTTDAARHKFTASGLDDATDAARRELTVSGRLLPKNWLAALVFVMLGQAVSVFTSYAAGFALFWHVTESTASPLTLSVAMLFSMVPAGIIFPFGGLVADKFNRKLIMICADGMIGLVSMVCALLCYFWKPSIVLIFTLTFFRSIGQGFHTPASQAIVPMLVPERHLMRANSVSQTIYSAANIVAPAFGIVLLTATDLSFCFLLDSIGAVLAVGAIIAVKVPTVRDPSADDQHAIRNMLDAWGVVRKNKSLLLLILTTVATSTIMTPVASFYALMTLEHFGGDGLMAATIESIWGGFMLVGSLVLLAWGGGKRLALLATGSVAGFGLTCALSGLLTPDQFNYFCVLTGMGALCWAFYYGPLYTLIQRLSPEEKLGRINGLMGSMSQLVSPIGLLLFAYVAEHTGVATVFKICGAILALISVSAYCLKPIRTLDS